MKWISIWTEKNIIIGGLWMDPRLTCSQNLEWGTSCPRYHTEAHQDGGSSCYVCLFKQVVTLFNPASKFREHQNLEVNLLMNFRKRNYNTSQYSSPFLLVFLWALFFGGGHYIPLLLFLWRFIAHGQEGGGWELVLTALDVQMANYSPATPSAADWRY